LDSKQADKSSRDGATPIGAKLTALARRAEAVIVFERFWPPLVWAATLVALFLALSWLGLWQALPRVARMGGVAAFAIGFIVALAPLARLRRPVRTETLDRLDRDSGAPHRPAASLDDQLAMAGDDPATAALWALHRERLARQVERFVPAAPAPGMSWRDPRALRFAVLLAAIAAALVAGPERYGRIAAAFDWRNGAAAAATARLDAWIDPPPYANKPPILLDLAANRDRSQKIVTPEGSALVVRADAGAFETQVEGAIAPVAAGKPANSSAQAPTPAGGAPTEKRWTIAGDGAVVFHRDGATLGRYEIQATPLDAPTVTLLEPPRGNLSGSLTLHYSLADRYGIAGAEVEVAKPTANAAPPRSLVPPPKLALRLPSTANGTGEASTTGDLSEHPWAGAQVVLNLKATSVSGKVGAGAPTTFALPQRTFHNPLARALVEQRRTLVLDPDHETPRVAKAIDALTIAPDLFQTPAGVYLGLRQAHARLADAHGDADLLAVADLLWAMALKLEDGDASQAQRDLRAAEQKLREALQRGASDEELRKLTQELRDAAERYMRDLAQQAPQQQNDADSQRPQQDLESMLDRMQDMARNGSRQDAEAMLDEMQNMFENMRGAANAQEDQASREMRKQMNELGKLLRDQQALRDDTFRQDQREQLGRDAPEGQGDPASPSLEERQRALGDRLAELQKRLKSLGMKGEKGFDAAQGDMKEAERNLKSGGQGQDQQGQGQGDGQAQGQGQDQGQGDKGGGDGLDEQGRTGKGRAVEAQGRALEALRQGAQGTQQQAQGNGQGGGRGYRAMSRRPGAGGPGRDPLGRDSGNRGGALDGALNGGADVAERARQVLEELRRRLADPNRPEEERDYFERLLKRD
jgi:uncharacterized protein (TIGR02302 family)